MYSISKDSRRVIVTMAGSIQVAVALALREEVLEFTEKGYTEFVFNVKDVEYMDSTGLGVFISVRNSLKDKSGSIKVVGAQGKVEKLLAMTRLKEVFCTEEG